MCCHSRSLQLFGKGQRTVPVTTEYQDSLHQAQDDINSVEHSPNGLFVLGRSPMYTFRWLGIRKTLARLTFEAEKSHFSFLFVLLHLRWMTLIFLLLFYDSWEKKDSRCANIILIPLAWREPATGEILDLFFFFFFSFRSDRFWATLLLAPDLKLGFPEPWGGGGNESFHVCANQLKFYKAPPFAGKRGCWVLHCWPLMRVTFSLKQSESVPVKLYTVHVCVRIKHVRASIVLCTVR